MANTSDSDSLSAAFVKAMSDGIPDHEAFLREDARLFLAYLTPDMVAKMPYDAWQNAYSFGKNPCFDEYVLKTFDLEDKLYRLSESELQSVNVVLLFLLAKHKKLRKDPKTAYSPAVDQNKKSIFAFLNHVNDLGNIDEFLSVYDMLLIEQEPLKDEGGYVTFVCGKNYDVIANITKQYKEHIRFSKLKTITDPVFT